MWPGTTGGSHCLPQPHLTSIEETQSDFGFVWSGNLWTEKFIERLYLYHHKNIWLNQKSFIKQTFTFYFKFITWVLASVADDFTITVLETPQFWFNVINIWWWRFWWVSFTICWIKTAWNEFREDKTILKPDLVRIQRLVCQLLTIIAKSKSIVQWI